MLLLLASNIFAQVDSIIKLFPGKWKMISDETEYYETQRGNTLAVKNKLLFDSYLFEH